CSSRTTYGRCGAASKASSGRSRAAPSSGAGRARAPARSGTWPGPDVLPGLLHAGALRPGLALFLAPSLRRITGGTPTISLLISALAAGLNMPCEQLKSVALERATITAAATVPAGVFSPPAGSGPGGTNPPPPQPIPEHCKVTMVLTPTPDSNIN